MARPLRIEHSGAFYHITARGNERKDIFKSIRDREQFLSYLSAAFERYKAVIHVYCLMSNHYHLLLEMPSGNLSQIVRHINGAYMTGRVSGISERRPGPASQAFRQPAGGSPEMKREAHLRKAIALIKQQLSL